MTVNDHEISFIIRDTPWGEAPGWGRGRGLEGLEEFTQTQTVVADRGAKRVYWYPYGPGISEYLRWGDMLLFSRRWGPRLVAMVRATAAMTRLRPVPAPSPVRMGASVANRDQPAAR